MLANFSFGGAAHAHVAAADKRRRWEGSREIDRGRHRGTERETVKETGRGTEAQTHRTYARQCSVSAYISLPLSLSALS